MFLHITTTTQLKLLPVQATSLKADQQVNIPKGTVLPVRSHELLNKGHLKVELDGIYLGTVKQAVWYAYELHVELHGNQLGNQPKDQPSEEPVDNQQMVTLPRLGAVPLKSTILENGNFTWAEATKNGQRIPVSESIVDGILRVAAVLEEIRSKLGDKPIIVTSWYRDPVTNRQVGGASQSRHLSGDAVDFQVKGLKPSSVQTKLDKWYGARGGLASANTFTHIDVRGYKARWSY